MQLCYRESNPAKSWSNKSAYRWPFLHYIYQSTYLINGNDIYIRNIYGLSMYDTCMLLPWDFLNSIRTSQSRYVYSDCQTCLLSFTLFPLLQRRERSSESSRRRFWGGERGASEREREIQSCARSPEAKLTCHVVELVDLLCVEEEWWRS